MLLDIRACLKGVNMPFSLSKELDCGSFDFREFTVRKPLEYTLKASLDGSCLALHLSINAQISSVCARCLDDITELFLIEEKFVISEHDLVDQDFELTFDEVLRLNIDETVMQELILKLPLVYYCGENCSSLCQVCGKLSVSCDCKKQGNKQEIDPRWQVLKDLI